MISSGILKKVLTDLHEITGADLILLNADGKTAASAMEVDFPDECREAAVRFLQNGVLRAEEAGWSMYRTSEGGRIAMVLAASGPAAPMACRIGVSELETIGSAVRERPDRGRFLQSVMLGRIEAPDLHPEAARAHVREDAKRVVLTAAVKAEDTETALQIMKAVLTSARSGDTILEMNAGQMAVIHEMRPEDSRDKVRKLAHALADTLNSEAMIPVRISWGTCAEQLQDLQRSYREACLAMEVGRIFLPDQRVIDYDNLGIGRLIYQLPVPLCEKFLQETFDTDVLEELDKETMTTVRQFFANDLNISETARQLFVHRNTLVYRLERLEKVIGLDIRKFEEAMTFRIAMMVHDCLKNRDPEGPAV